MECSACRRRSDSKNRTCYYRKIHAFLAEYYTYTWEQALPHSVNEKVENAIPNVSAFILERGISFLKVKKESTSFKND